MIKKKWEQKKTMYLAEKIKDLKIAKLFLKDSIILLLDEITSELDKESEKGVQASIDILQQRRTSAAV